MAVPGGTCVAEMRASIVPGVGGTFTTISAIDVDCVGNPCAPPVDSKCSASGQFTLLSGLVLASGQLKAGCSSQTQVFAPGTTKVIFHMRCSDCDGVAPKWDAPLFPDA